MDPLCDFVLHILGIRQNSDYHVDREDISRLSHWTQFHPAACRAREVFPQHRK
jgi:hypothetical protein